MSKEFEDLKFPIVKNVAETTIADSIESIQPSPEYHSPVKRRYKNHMGGDVVEYENGFCSTHSYHPTHLYGDSGHAFGRGWFIVDETGNMIFMGDEGYNELVEKCRPFWKLSKLLKERFPDYRIEMSRGDRLAVNDKIIKGLLYYPGMFRGVPTDEVINEELEFISGEIQRDIDRGRIKAGEYGTE